MSFFKKLFGRNKSKMVSREELISMDVCPNCWGRQKYQGGFNEKYNDLNKLNVSFNKANGKTFIKEYVGMYATDIRLKTKGNKFSCPSCKKEFKK